MTKQQRVMTNIKTNSLIRTLLIAGVLVVGILFSAHLFGQNGNGLLSKEGKQNEQVSGRSEKTQTPVDGDLVEYVTKYHNQEQKGYQSRHIIYPLYSKDRTQLVYTLYDTENFVYRETVGGTESQHRSYLYSYSSGQKEPKLLGTNGEIINDPISYTRPLYWFDEVSVLVQGVTGPIEVFHGVSIVNTKTGLAEKIPMNEPYVGAPILYDNNTKMFYGGFLPAHEFAPEFSTPNTFWSYDFVTKTTTRLEKQPDVVTKSLEQQYTSSAKNSDPFGQDFSVMSHSCAFSGTPTLYLPWPCNKAMCVERDGPMQCSGNNCTSNSSGWDWNTEYSDCSLNPGSNYTGACNSCASTCGHTRPAIDFGDGGLWTQTGSDVLASANGEAQRRHESSGAGNYVVIRHPKSGGGYVYSYYMHLANGSIPSWIPNNSNWNNNTWAAVSRGNRIGFEGATGGNYSPHYHFEMRSADAPGNSYYPIFMEYGGCTPKTGRTYISKNVPTDGSMQLGYDCSYVTNLTCSNTQTLMNLTNNGASSRFATYGNGYHDWDEYGPERLYKITTTQTGTITATLSGVNYINGNDLDVFILRNPSSTSCSNLDPIAHCLGTSSGLTSTYVNAPAGTYYIVVDGYNGSTANYNLTVTAPCSSGNSLPNLTEYGSSYTSSGSTLTITAKPVNYGTVNAGAFSIGYWLSPDNVFGNGNDIGLASVNYGGLFANSYNQFTFSVNTSGIAPIGNYYILFKIDYQNQVVESNESDNVWMFNALYYLPTSVSSKTSPVLTPIKQIVADGIDEVIDNEEWTDRYEETQLVSEKQQEQEIWLWKDGYDRWVTLLQSGEVLTITDITGKVIKTLGSREDGEIWLPKLPSGMYVVTICCDGLNKEKVGKIMY